MLGPKKTKFKKCKKGSLKYCEKKVFFLDKFKEGNIRLVSSQFSRVSAKQLECCRQSINKKIKKQGKLQIKIFTDLPVTKKPTEIRMGKGKGSLNFWSCIIRPGTVLFEIFGAKKETALLALSSTAKKLPVKVVFFL